MQGNIAREPDLPLDDEIESHVDHGQVQVEPGDADNEARELECGDARAIYHMEIKHDLDITEESLDAALDSLMRHARAEILARCAEALELPYCGLADETDGEIA